MISRTRRPEIRQPCAILTLAPKQSSHSFGAERCVRWWRRLAAGGGQLWDPIEEASGAAGRAAPFLAPRCLDTRRITELVLFAFLCRDLTFHSRNWGARLPSGPRQPVAPGHMTMAAILFSYIPGLHCTLAPHHGLGARWPTARLQVSDNTE